MWRSTENLGVLGCIFINIHALTGVTQVLFDGPLPCCLVDREGQVCSFDWWSDDIEKTSQSPEYSYLHFSGSLSGTTIFHVQVGSFHFGSFSAHTDRWDWTKGELVALNFLSAFNFPILLSGLGRQLGHFTILWNKTLPLLLHGQCWGVIPLRIFKKSLSGRGRGIFF